MCRFDGLTGLWWPYRASGRARDAWPPLLSLEDGMVLPVTDGARHLPDLVVDQDAADRLDDLLAVLEVDGAVCVHGEVHADQDVRVETALPGRVAGLEPVDAVDAPDVAGHVALRDVLAELVGAG